MQRRMPELMEARGLSGRQLAARSHVAVNTVRQTLRGRSRPSIGKVLAYAAALGVTVDYLFGESPVEALVAEALTSDETPHMLS